VDIARTFQETITQQKEWNALSTQTWDISQNVVRPTSPLDPLRNHSYVSSSVYFKVKFFVVNTEFLCPGFVKFIVNCSKKSFILLFIYGNNQRERQSMPRLKNPFNQQKRAGCRRCGYRQNHSRDNCPAKGMKCFKWLILIDVPYLLLSWVLGPDRAAF
jgi:hypothetical protein